MATIFVTKFCPETKRVSESAKDSGFTSIQQVIDLMGPPLNRGFRTATYRTLFYSEYSLHQTQSSGGSVFLNREA